MRTERDDEMERVLVVDDDAVIRDLLAAILEDETDYEVLMAANGREALDRLAESRVDAIVCDVNMPVMNGIELVRAVRSDPKLRQVPVIMISAVATPATLDPRLDIDVMIEKPFDISTLTACLAFVFNGVRSSRQQVWIIRRRAAVGGESPRHPLAHNA
ncbi:MAG TPA: response regulator [Thermomicrobiales bacterium]|nr:response regulator [Thermomicrobiales bacterium]